MGIGELPPNAPPGTTRVITGRTVRQVNAQVALDSGTTLLPCLEWCSRMIGPSPLQVVQARAAFSSVLVAPVGQALWAMIRRGMITPSVASAGLTSMSWAMSWPRLGGVDPKCHSLIALRAAHTPPLASRWAGPWP